MNGPKATPWTTWVKSRGQKLLIVLPKKVYCPYFYSKKKDETGFPTLKLHNLPYTNDWLSTFIHKFMARELKNSLHLRPLK